MGDNKLTKEKKPKKEREVNRITEIQKQYENEQNLLEIAFKKRELSEEEYYQKSIVLASKFREERKGLNAKELASQTEFNIKLEEIGVDYLNKLHERNKLEINYIKYDAEKIDKINEDRRKREASFMTKFIGEDLQRIKDYFKKKETEGEKHTKAQKELEEALYNLKIQGVQAFAEISSTITQRAMSDIEARSDKEIEAIDLKEQRELDSLDRLSISQSEKDERKKKIELEAEARRQKIEKEKIKDLRKFAVFQKGVDTLAIISTTALGVMKALAMTPPNPILAISTGIAGATQLAKVLATPLPQYEFGTPEGGHIGGKAQVGEAGTELGITPDGKVFLTPNKTTIMDLPKRTQIIPHDITKEILNATMINLAKTNQAVTLDKFQLELINSFERTQNKVIDELKRTKTNITFNGDMADYIYTQSKIM